MQNIFALTYIIKCPSAFSDLDALFHDAHVTEFLLLGVRLAADVAVLGVGHVAVGEGDLAGRGHAAVGAGGGGLGVARHCAANLKPNLVREGMEIWTKEGGITTMATRLYRPRLKGCMTFTSNSHFLTLVRESLTQVPSISFSLPRLLQPRGCGGW